MRTILMMSGLTFSLLAAGCGGAHEEPAPTGLVSPGSGQAAPAGVTGASANALVGGNYPVARQTAVSKTAVQSFKARHEYLMGTEMDGNWPVLESGQLEPSIALKRRFDYILLAIGRESEAEMTTLLNTLADEELNSSHAAVVKDLWLKYLQLLKVEFSARPDPKSATAMAAYLAQANAKREQLLGKEWAQAFFAEEDKAFLALAVSP